MLAELQDKGVCLSVEGENLVVETQRQMSDEQRKFIKQNKQLLIEKLNKQRCTSCIHLFPCSCARNGNGICPDGYQHTINRETT